MQEYHVDIVDGENEYYNTVVKYGWIYILWKWADENNIHEEKAIYPDYPLKNNYRGIPRNKDILKSLEYLDLSDFGLNKIPEEIVGLSNLISLDLSDNNLEYLPESIINFERLESLYVCNNNLHEIDEQLGLLNNLQRIDLTGNYLTNITKEIQDKIVG